MYALHMIVPALPKYTNCMLLRYLWIHDVVTMMKWYPQCQVYGLEMLFAVEQKDASSLRHKKNHYPYCSSRSDLK